MMSCVIIFVSIEIESISLQKLETSDQSKIE